MHVRGEELLANWFGWTNRALEATAVADEVPWAWKQYAFRGYLALQEVDRRMLEGRLPAGRLLQPAAERAQAGRSRRPDADRSRSSPLSGPELYRSPSGAAAAR